MVSELLIKHVAQVREALRQLEATASKTLFVVSSSETLVGTLTDGDVRRWILSGGDLNGAVEDVCNKTPFLVDESYDREAAKREMLTRRINCIPIIDPRRRVVGALQFEKLFTDEAAAAPAHRIDLPVVIMAGGKGTRLAPFTSVLPKPLIPLGDKTVIERIVDSFTAFGVGLFYLSVNYKSKIIKSYFDELAPPYEVRYLYEDKPLGTAGSLRGLAGQLDSDLIVTNCDIIIRTDYCDVVSFHNQNQNDITLVVSLKNYSIPYGVCELESSGQLKEIREKPEYNFLVNTGLYVLRPATLELIPENQFFHITDLIAAVTKRGGKVGVFPISDKAWIDTGEWAQYRNAVFELTGERRKSPR